MYSFEKIMQDRIKNKNGIFVISGSESDADCFDLDDVKKWENSRFEQSWKNPVLLNNHVSLNMIKYIIDDNKPVIDVATGPGMGFIPSLKIMNPNIPCMGGDASEILINAWKKFFEKNPELPDIVLAQFSLMDIPFKDGSVDAFTSFLGISSTRNGEQGYDRVLSEMYRTLKPGGKIFTIEGEWMDRTKFIELFSKMNMEPWKCFIEETKTWQERFTEHGFQIICEEVFQEHYFNDEEDFELSRAAINHNITIGMIYRGYIIQK